MTRSNNTQRAGKMPANVRQVVNSVLAQRAEEKYFISNLTATTTVAAGLVTALTQGIIQGDNVFERSGNAVFLDSVDLRLKLDGSTSSPNSVRFIIVLDRLNLGTLPTVTEILNAATVVSPPAVNGYINKRFMFLYDESISMGGPGASNFAVNRHVQKKIRKKLVYNGTTSVASANGTNSIFTLLLTDVGASGATATYSCGMHYTDI